MGLDGAKPVEELSSGERQRVALLRALGREPSVLLLDEPTRSLDPDSARSVEELILEWCAGERAVLWVTHDPAQAARLGGRVFTVGDGGVAVGPPDGGEVSS